jgi:HAD superfamily hydrolase (TIGR01484 family)
MTQDEPSPAWLLVSDVDDTLAGDDEGIVAFSRLRSGVSLVLNSSRPLADVRRTLARFPVLLPLHGIIGGLGTEILLEGVLRVDWQERFSDWDRTPVDAVMEAAGMRPHPREMQTPYKASFAVPQAEWRKMKDAVRQAVPACRIITSGTSDFDVIPAAAGKDQSTLWVAARLGIPPDRLIVAGDSGNDLAMFHAAAKAIAVGNARPELRHAADPLRTYFATAPRAWGLIEGLRHWGAVC